MSTLMSKHPLAPFRAEILNEALAICRGRPFGDLRRPRIVHLHGVVAMQQGYTDLALAYFTRAIQLAPLTPAIYNDLGDALLRKGQVSESTGAHLKALILASDKPYQYVRLGRAMQQHGLYLEALATYLWALRLAPDDPDIYGDLGDVLYALGKLKKAVECYTQALQLAPEDADCYRRLGRARLRVGEVEQALGNFTQGLELQRDRADLHIDIGEAFLRLGQLEHAAQAFYTALTISPRDVAANRHFVLTTELLGRRRDAVGGWINLGFALETCNRFREASTAYRQAITRKADCLRGLIGLGRVHVALGEPGEAIRQLEAAITVDPEHAPAHVHLGLALQQVGEFERGWNELTWFYHPHNPIWRHVEQPVWDGSPLAGRTLLLWTHDEQSTSETIQYLRYVPFAKDLGGRVMLECDRTLVPLVRHTRGIDYVVASGGPLLPYDVHAPLLHLPALVKAARSSLGEVPYLSPPEERWPTWCERVTRSDARLIGIAWAGDAGERRRLSAMASLSVFAPLATVPRVRLINLQLGPHGHEMLAPPDGLNIESYLGDACSLVELATTISNLDLVITVDSNVSHLAGALGKPVWMLLSHGAGWPWPREGNQTPWYPTMRLFRQTRPGDWSGALEAVRAELL